MERNVNVWLLNRKRNVLLKRIAVTRKTGEGLFKSQLNPFVHEPTWSGKIKEGECPLEAVIRMCEEKLGIIFAKSFPFDSLQFFSQKKNKEGEEEHNFWGTISSRQKEEIGLHTGAFPELVVLDRKDFGKVKTTEDPTAEPEKEIVLFPGPYEALKELFSRQEREDSRSIFLLRALRISAVFVGAFSSFFCCHQKRVAFRAFFSGWLVP